MKEFRGDRGNVIGKTMTVAELVAKLAEYPHDMPVFGEWEGVHGYIDENSFGTEVTGKGFKDDDCECLLIYVENY